MPHTHTSFAGGTRKFHKPIPAHLVAWCCHMTHWLLLRATVSLDLTLRTVLVQPCLPQFHNVCNTASPLLFMSVHQSCSMIILIIYSMKWFGPDIYICSKIEHPAVRKIYIRSEAHTSAAQRPSLLSSGEDTVITTYNYCCTLR